MLIKGPEVAALYPELALRPFGDLDVLADDPEAAHEALRAEGFVPVGHDDDFYADRHHLRPLQWPDLPLTVELHRRPEWPSWSQPPSFGELLEEASPAQVEVDGLLAPSPAAHALIVTAHSWSESPLRRMLDLVDALVLAEGVEREVERLAAKWQMAGVWRTTRTAAEGILLGKRRPWSIRIWARDLPGASERSVLANHFRPLFGAFWALPPGTALLVVSRRLASVFRPALGESWRTRSLRITHALRDAFTDVSEHNLKLGEHGLNDQADGGSSPAHRGAGAV
jgi:hypothetical protein